MFTGIIEEIGVISTLIRGGKSLRLSVYAKKVLEDLKVGDSVSLNGVCLTVTELGRNHFSVDAVEETLKYSNLSRLKIGDKVNLERAAQLSSRLGGHIMNGHIDGAVDIKGKIVRETGFELILSLPKELKRYLISKGSVGIEGVSLTIAKISSEGVHVAVIPHTAQHTTLGLKNVGEKVNLEVDILSKYLEGLLQAEAPESTEKVMLGAGFMPLGIWDN